MCFVVQTASMHTILLNILDNTEQRIQCWHGKLLSDTFYSKCCADGGWPDVVKALHENGQSTAVQILCVIPASFW